MIMYMYPSTIQIDNQNIIINFEDKEQETEEKIENQTEEEMGESEDSENNRKKVRYEDGTWKFF